MLVHTDIDRARVRGAASELYQSRHVFDSNLTAMPANNGGRPRTEMPGRMAILILSGRQWTAMDTPDPVCKTAAKAEAVQICPDPPPRPRFGEASNGQRANAVPRALDLERGYFGQSQRTPEQYGTASAALKACGR